MQYNRMKRKTKPATPRQEVKKSGDGHSESYACHSERSEESQQFRIYHNEHRERREVQLRRSFAALRMTHSESLHALRPDELL